MIELISAIFALFEGMVHMFCHLWLGLRTVKWGSWVAKDHSTLLHSCQGCQCRFWRRSSVPLSMIGLLPEYIGCPRYRSAQSHSHSSATITLAAWRLNRVQCKLYGKYIMSKCHYGKLVSLLVPLESCLMSINCMLSHMNTWGRSWYLNIIHSCKYTHNALLIISILNSTLWWHFF